MSILKTIQNLAKRTWPSRIPEADQGPMLIGGQILLLCWFDKIALCIVVVLLSRKMWWISSSSVIYYKVWVLVIDELR